MELLVVNGQIVTKCSPPFRALYRVSEPVHRQFTAAVPNSGTRLQFHMCVLIIIHMVNVYFFSFFSINPVKKCKGHIVCCC